MISIMYTTCCMNLSKQCRLLSLPRTVSVSTSTTVLYIIISSCTETLNYDHNVLRLHTTGAVGAARDSAFLQANLHDMPGWALQYVTPSPFKNKKCVVFVFDLRDPATLKERIMTQLVPLCRAENPATSLLLVGVKVGRLLFRQAFFGGGQEDLYIRF